MFRNKFFVMLVLIGALFSQSASPVSVDPLCDMAQYVSDPAVPDGASFSTGAAFTKTWRLMNAGTCTWTTSYKLVFVNGDSLGAPASVNMPVQVSPGQMVDISVNMTAPTAAGHYRGNWKLSNESGTAFGIGSSASDAFWVDINVININTVIYDFAANAPYAQWKSAAGVLPYPGTSGDSRGFSFQVNNPRLEDDSVDTLPGLLMVPHNKYNGYIQAIYPEFLVQAGDHFQTLVNCEFGAKGCYVTFSLNYMTSSGSVKTFWSWKETYEGRFYRADIDLSRLAGQKVRFILNLSAAGLASGDRALWGAPRIVRTGSVQPPAPAPTLTPLPALTPTPTPFSTPPLLTPAACERASFVADITVPDGTLFSPGAGFTKTWRLKNSGSCAWTTSFRFVFYSGTQMDAPTVLNVPRVVVPGDTVDLSLNMVAPLTAGSYRGHWILQDPSGALFGIGRNANMPIWVQVNVAGEAPVDTGYDFVKNACAAEWKVPVGISPCPGLNGDLSGFVLPLSSTQLEDGTRGPAPSLLMAPTYKYNGYIQGFYPTFTVQPGDRFQTAVGCEYGSPCYVTFKLDYMTATGSISNFWSWREQNDGRFHNADVDLTPLAGRNVRFILTILATGSPAGDRALWAAPRILRREPPIIPTTVTPTHTPTATQTPAPAEWQTLLNLTYAFQLRYPADAQKVTGSNDHYTRINLPFQPGTNLVEKYLDVIVVENAAVCRSPLVASSTLRTSETVTINGLTFLKETGEDGAAGQLYQWIAYSTAQGTRCVSLDFILHSTSPGTSPTPPPVFDIAAESGVFQNIVSTFAWSHPGSNWLTFSNARYGFQFLYPLEGQITTQEDSHARITLPFAAGTNLREKYLDVVVTENVTTCRSPLATAMSTTESLTINGLTFLKETGDEGALGSYYVWIAYSISHGSTCVSLDFVLHSTNPSNFETPPPVFDLAAESAIFQNIVSTFAWQADRAVVQSVEIQVVESQPLQVNAIVRGQLPDNGCTTISSVNQARDGNTFQLTLTTATNPSVQCSAVPTPFEQVVVLDVSNLPPASYKVSANGTVQTFELVTRDFTKFGQDVVAALNAQNFDLAKILMDTSFTIAFWQSQGQSYTPETAIQEMRTNYLSATSHLTADPGKDLNALLNGTDPYSIMGLDSAKSQVLFISGWGLDGKDEALLYFTRLPDGSLYWHSVLIAKGGFATFTSQGTYAVAAVAPNDVLNIRSDAGVEYPIIGWYPPDATDIVRTGPSKMAGGAEWVEVQRPGGGTGWVNFRHLTEYVTRDAFCSDLRVRMSVDLLRHALIQSNGGLFASLVGPKRGVVIQFWRDGAGASYTTATAQTIFTDPTAYDWGAGPAAGPEPLNGTFAQIVQPDMVDVFNSNYQLGCDNPSYAAMYVNPWPHMNIHYYSVLKPPTPDIVFDWKVWLIGFEYVDGRPYLYGTIHYVWEP